LIAKDAQAFVKLTPYLLDANVALVKGNLIKNLLQVELNDICPLVTFEGEMLQTVDVLEVIFPSFLIILKELRHLLSSKCETLRHRS
jgi:hypothetical protein